MKQLFSQLSRPIVVASILIVALAVSAGVIFLRYDRTDAIAPSKPVAAKPAQSDFSFAGATGWHTGPSNETSLALFSDDYSSGCFTSMEYKTGTIDINADLQKQQDGLASSGGAMTPVSTSTITLNMNATTQPYALHQYSLSGGAEKLMGGLELGYIQLAKGYIEVQGHCNTAAQLSTTISALQAYRFRQAN